MTWPQNHNAHIEQKKGSVLRTFIGDVRLGDVRLKRAFDLLLEAITLHANHFRPCVMLVSKTKRPDGKGWRCVYDAPKTPAQRALDSGRLTPENEKRLLDTLKNTNGVWLMELIRKRYSHLLALKRKLEKEKKSSNGCEGSSSASPLRGAPAGAAFSSPSHPSPALGTTARPALLSVSSI